MACVDQQKLLPEVQQEADSTLQALQRHLIRAVVVSPDLPLAVDEDQAGTMLNGPWQGVVGSRIVVRESRGREQPP
jgi:hypothetical protein